MYIFPSAVINFITYTAKRWGQFPTITYIGGGVAGAEVVTLTDNPLSAPNITIKIQSTVSTNTQIVAAINSAKVSSVDGLYASDMVSMVITGGHGSDTNTASGPTALSGASSVPPPVPPQPFQPTGVTPGSYTSTDLTVDEFGRITDASNGAGGGGASTALDNLITTSINMSLLPTVDNSIDLGNAAQTWKDFYLSGKIIFDDDPTCAFTFDVGNGYYVLTGPGGAGAVLRGTDSLTFQSDSGPTPSSINLASTGTSTIHGGVHDLVAWDDGAGAGETTMLLYDADAGTLQRVKVTANNAVIGVTGRVLYVPAI